MLTHTYVTSTSCWIILEKLLPCFSLPCLQGAADQGKIASIAHGSSMLSVASDRYYMHRILVLRPDQKKINNGIPTFSLQNFTNSLLTQPHAMSPSDTQQMCCFYTSCVLFVHVCSVLSNYIYIFMYVCDMWPYGPIWLNMAQFWRSHGSTSTSLMHFITLLWAPRVRRWLNQDPNELFKLSNHALSKFRVRLFRQVSAAAWALMATCCWFCFFLHGFSSWTLFGKHGEFCAAKSVPMLWLDGWGVARYCKILQTIRLRSGWQHDNDFARTSSAVLQSPCSSKADSAKWFTKPFVAPQYVYLPNCTWMDL